MMFFTRGQGSSALALIGICVVMPSHAAGPDQHPPPPASQQEFASAAGPKGSASPAGDFPRAPHDPAAVARGKQIFSVNCGFCHGSDARGGEGGPNLLRSPLVLNDQEGEVIAAVVLNGRVEKGMPKFNLALENVADIAAFLHSIDIGRGAAAQFDPQRVLVGNAAAGKSYFNGKGGCSACHSVKKDLAGIGSKYDPKTLQDTIFNGGGTGMLGIRSPTAPPRTVSVTMPTGELIKGRLVSIDDFIVVLTDADGNRRTLRRDGDSPMIQVNNPLQAHLDKIRGWEDEDLHNLTAYLVTLK
jgi:cytochrome c oxidase cbb3-type subunit III